MIRRLAWLSLLLLVVLACSAATRAHAEGARAGDVRLLADHLRRDHPNLFHDLSPAVFESAVDDLAARADSIGDDELLAGLMRIAALPGVRDGHTGIFPLDPSNRRMLHVYPVIISRATFSAAENFAVEVERLAHPVFVGEPSGGSPNLYGDTTATLLPVSGVTAHVATIYSQKSTPNDPRVASHRRCRSRCHLPTSLPGATRCSTRRSALRWPRRSSSPFGRSSRTTGTDR